MRTSKQKRKISLKKAYYPFQAISPRLIFYTLFSIEILYVTKVERRTVNVA